MSDEHKPPTTQAEAVQMILPLNPEAWDIYTEQEKKLAYDRLMEFIRLLLPEE